MTKAKLAGSKSYRAIKSGTLIPSKTCIACGKKKRTEGHHRDYDRPLDVVWLCRSCHMIEDGRMKLIHSIDRHAPPKKCKNCGMPSKPLRKGLCHPCNEYLRRQGRDRPYKKDGRHEKTIGQYSKPCKRCGRRSDVVGKPIRGFCTSCYTVLWRNNGIRLDLGKHIKNRKIKKEGA